MQVIPDYTNCNCVCYTARVLYSTRARNEVSQVSATFPPPLPVLAMAELTTSDVLSVEDGSSMEPPSREPSEGPEETVDGGTLKHRKKKKSRTILDGET